MCGEVILRPDPGRSPSTHGSSPGRARARGHRAAPREHAERLLGPSGARSRRGSGAGRAPGSCSLASHDLPPPRQPVNAEALRACGAARDSRAAWGAAQDRTGVRSGSPCGGRRVRDPSGPAPPPPTARSGHSARSPALPRAHGAHSARDRARPSAAGGSSHRPVSPQPCAFLSGFRHRPARQCSLPAGARPAAAGSGPGPARGGPVGRAWLVAMTTGATGCL